MNYCVSCGQPLAENAAFCPNCGTKVEKDEATENTSIHKADEPVENETDAGEEVVEKIAGTFSNVKETVQKSPYFTYFVETIQRPTSSIGMTSPSHGWIQLILFAAMTALSIYEVIKHTIRIGLGFISYFGGEVNIPNDLRNEMISRIFVASFVVYLTFIVAIFILLRVIAQSKRSFNELVTEIGGLFTPNILLLFVAFLLTFLFASSFSIKLAVFLIVLSSLLCLMSYNFYLYSRVSIEGLDKLYVLLISNLFLLLLLFLLVYIQIEPVFTLVDQINSQRGGFRW